MDSPGCEPRILRSASAQSRRKPRILRLIVDDPRPEPQVRAPQPMIGPPEGATDIEPGASTHHLEENGPGETPGANHGLYAAE